MLIVGSSLGLVLCLVLLGLRLVFVVLAVGYLGYYSWVYFRLNGWMMCGML